MIALPADLNGLARYAAGQPWWQWKGGMRAFDVGARPFRVNGAHPRGGVLATLGEPGFSVIPMSPESLMLCWPDVTDGATLGCLLHRLREVSGDPGVSIACNRWSDGSVDWNVHTDVDGPVSGLLYPTEAHALVAALDAVWGAA